MLTESYFPRSWSSDSESFGFEDDDEWLLKSALKQSSCPNRARMNLGLAVDQASSDKENVTYLDVPTRLFIGAALPAGYNSPTKFSGAVNMSASLHAHVRTPLDDQDPNSQDSGYCPSDDSKSAFRFVEPYGFPPRKNSVEPSPRKELMSPSSKSPAPSPTLMYSRSMSSGTESTDDGFLDSMFVGDKMDEDAQLLANQPSNMMSLLSGSIRRDALPTSPSSPMVFEPSHYDEFARPPLRRCQSSIGNTTPQTSRVRTALFRSSQQVTVVRTSATNVEGSPMTQLANSALTSLSLTTTSSTFKRPEPPCKSSPILKKRRRSLLSIHENEASPTSPRGTLMHYGFEKTTVKLQRSMSASEATIMSALTRSSQDPHLIGDFSKPFALPLMEGRHQDLKNISCDTLANLIKGHYDEQIASYTIVDCRYPYEYEGGHIVGAKNIFTKEQIMKEFVETKNGLNKPNASDSDAGSKRNILIFHCEFSSERGPAMSRFLRNSDRDTNKECYPTLDYPEMYLLNGGYKQFYEKHQDLCEPRSYRPMTHPDHENDLRKFRSKSKSWNGGDGKTRLAPRCSLKRLGL